LARGGFARRFFLSLAFAAVAAALAFLAFSTACFFFSLANLFSSFSAAFSCAFLAFLALMTSSVLSVSLRLLTAGSSSVIWSHGRCALSFSMLKPWSSMCLFLLEVSSVLDIRV
jgi:hypothetical protein